MVAPVAAPIWAASPVERALLVLVPLPRIPPGVSDWRIRSRAFT